MPEIVEVEIIREWLDRNYRGCLIKESFKFPEIVGMTIDNVSRKGKQIFFKLVKRVERAEGDERDEESEVGQNKICLYLNSRLGLQGKWTATEANNTRFWMKLIKESGPFSASAEKGRDKEFILYNDDSQNFGDIELFNETQYINKLSKIGPDFLNDKIDIQDWMSKIKNKRIKNKQICDYLLEQKYFSGIGNYLKADILYSSKIKPDRTLESLTDSEIRTLLEKSFEIIKRSQEHGGLTIKTFWSPEGKKGMYPTLVYDKKQDPLGNNVIKSTFKDKRVTHWVPEVQK